MNYVQSRTWSTLQSLCNVKDLIIGNLFIYVATRENFWQTRQVGQPVQRLKIIIKRGNYMRNRRLFRLLAILFAFTLVAAACGDDDDSSSSSESSSASSASSSEASSAEGLNIGTLLPETGALAFLSAPLLEGVNMAIADINAAGGVNGADVTLTPGDSGTDPEIANTTVDRLLTEDVDAIVGAAASGITGSVIDKITSAGITQCSPSNTAAGLGTSGDDGFYFRTAPSDDLQAPALANVVLGDGYTNVAVVSRADDYLSLIHI